MGSLQCSHSSQTPPKLTSSMPLTGSRLQVTSTQLLWLPCICTSHCYDHFSRGINPGKHCRQGISESCMPLALQSQTKCCNETPLLPRGGAWNSASVPCESTIHAWHCSSLFQGVRILCEAWLVTCVTVSKYKGCLPDMPPPIAVSPAWGSAVSSWVHNNYFR